MGVETSQSSPRRTVVGVIRPSRRSTGTVLVVLTLSACGAAEDVVLGAADAAGDEARRAAREVTEQAVSDQVCQVVGDGQVTEAEVAVLRGAVAGAEGAGLSDEIASAVRDVVGTGGLPPDQAVQRLEDACGR